MKRGASDYLPKPFEPAQVRIVLHKVAELRALERDVESLRESLGQAQSEMQLASERAVILARGEEIRPEQFPFTPDAPRELMPEVGSMATLAELEEAHIRRVIATTETLEEAAQVLGIDQSILWRRRTQYGI